MRAADAVRPLGKRQRTHYLIGCKFKFQKGNPDLFREIEQISTENIRNERAHDFLGEHQVKVVN